MPDPSPPSRILHMPYAAVDFSAIYLPTLPREQLHRAIGGADASQAD